MTKTWDERNDKSILQVPTKYKVTYLTVREAPILR